MTETEKDKQFSEAIKVINDYIKGYLISRKNSKEIPEDRVETPITKAIDGLTDLVEILTWKDEKIGGEANNTYHWKALNQISPTPIFSKLI